MIPCWWRACGHEVPTGVVNQLLDSPPKGSDNCRGGSRNSSSSSGGDDGGSSKTPAMRDERVMGVYGGRGGDQLNQPAEDGRRRSQRRIIATLCSLCHLLRRKKPLRDGRPIQDQPRKTFIIWVSVVSLWVLTNYSDLELDLAAAAAPPPHDRISSGVYLGSRQQEGPYQGFLLLKRGCLQIVARFIWGGWMGGGDHPLHLRSVTHHLFK